LLLYRIHDNSICATHYEEQADKVLAISTDQINDLLPQYLLTPVEIEALRRCYHLKQLTKQDMALGGRLFFQLLKSFEHQPGIDHELVCKIRRQWIERLLATITANRKWGDLWCSGLLRSILQHDLLALLLALFIHLPSRVIGRIERNQQGWTPGMGVAE
jgi:hypothetical protein